jgi:hypothetical protein
MKSGTSPIEEAPPEKLSFPEKVDSRRCKSLTVVCLQIPYELIKCNEQKAEYIRKLCFFISISGMPASQRPRIFCSTDATVSNTFWIKKNAMSNEKNGKETANLTNYANWLFATFYLTLRCLRPFPTVRQGAGQLGANYSNALLSKMWLKPCTFSAAYL